MVKPNLFYGARISEDIIKALPQQELINLTNTGLFFTNQIEYFIGIKLRTFSEFSITKITNITPDRNDLKEFLDKIAQAAPSLDIDTDELSNYILFC